jgi:hypothetical protein
VGRWSTTSPRSDTLLLLMTSSDYNKQYRCQRVAHNIVDLTPYKIYLHKQLEHTMDPNMDAMSQDADMMEEEPEYGQ